MERNPKKSRALIIAFIIVIILGVVVYLLFKNRENIFNIQGKTTADKSFVPLLNTSKQDDVTPLNTVGTGGQNTNTGTPSTSSNQGATNPQAGTLINKSPFATSFPSSFGSPSGAITPSLNPIPAPSGATPSTPPPTLPPTTPTTASTPTTSTPNPNLCPDNDPLIFTDNEKLELEALLRQYYLLAPTLKTEDDVLGAEGDVTNNQALIDKANDLTKQCLLQKGSSNYTGPQTIKDNPYYSDPNGASGSIYIPEFGQLEQLFNIW
jgi:hypothetical protein